MQMRRIAPTIQKTQIVLEPEIEELFQKHKRSPGGEFLEEIVLGDPMYHQEFKFKGYSGPVSMLREPRVAVKYAHIFRLPQSKNAHRQRAEYFRNLAGLLNQEWQDVVSRASELYGKQGALISGVYRDHFPGSVKERLRFLTRGGQAAADAARVHEVIVKSRNSYFYE